MSLSIYPIYGDFMLQLYFHFRLEPAYVKYKFYNEPPVCTPALPLQSHLVWEHSTVLLLGIIQPELLLEYLRGPPLTLEIHDRDRKKEKDDDMGRAVFGSLWSDQIVGTVAFGKGIAH